MPPVSPCVAGWFAAGMAFPAGGEGVKVGAALAAFLLGAAGRDDRRRQQQEVRGVVGQGPPVQFAGSNLVPVVHAAFEQLKEFLLLHHRGHGVGTIQDSAPACSATRTVK